MDAVGLEACKKAIAAVMPTLNWDVVDSDTEDAADPTDDRPHSASLMPELGHGRFPTSTPLRAAPGSPVTGWRAEAGTRAVRTVDRPSWATAGDRRPQPAIVTPAARPPRPAPRA